MPNDLVQKSAMCHGARPLKDLNASINHSYCTRSSTHSQCSFSRTRRSHTDRTFFDRGGVWQHHLERIGPVSNTFSLQIRNRKISRNIKQTLGHKVTLATFKYQSDFKRRLSPLKKNRTSNKLFRMHNNSYLQPEFGISFDRSFCLLSQTSHPSYGRRLSRRDPSRPKRPTMVHQQKPRQQH